MGGSDPVGATARAVGAIGGAGLELVIVLGPGFHCDGDLTRALATAEARGHQVQCHYRPADLPSIMASCDVAVSSAGGTLAELCYLGRPTVAVAIVADQVANARLHADHGLAACGRRLDAMTDRELASVIADLLADEPARRRMRDLCAASVDGRGADRVLERLAA
jgi:spore coat polysaccharide biosynthesis predicted glycosyltransferase SpsG